MLSCQLRAGPNWGRSCCVPVLAALFCCCVCCCGGCGTVEEEEPAGRPHAAAPAAYGGASRQVAYDTDPAYPEVQQHVEIEMASETAGVSDGTDDGSLSLAEALRRRAAGARDERSAVEMESGDTQLARADEGIVITRHPSAAAAELGPAGQ